MKSNSLKKQDLVIRILNYISTAFALALLALQFLPFWSCMQCNTCGDGRMLSIIEYVWFARSHANGLTALLKNYYIPGFVAMDVVGTAVIIQLCSIGGAVLNVLRPGKSGNAVLPLAAGLAAVIGYFAPAYQLGQNWQLHVAVGAVTALCAIVTLVVAFVQYYKKTEASVLAEAEK